ncbi:MAG: hypothetical protein U0625_06835 [Phycisphaerales bacterium]
MLTLVSALALQAAQPTGRPDYRAILDASELRPVETVIVEVGGLDADALVTARARAILASQAKTLAALARAAHVRGPGAAPTDDKDDPDAPPEYFPADGMAVRRATALLLLSARAQLDGPEHDRAIGSIATLFSLGGQLARDRTIAGSMFSEWVLAQAMQAFDGALELDRVSALDAGRILSAMQRLDSADPTGRARALADVCDAWVTWLRRERAQDAGAEGARKISPPPSATPDLVAPLTQLRSMSEGEWAAGAQRVAALWKRSAQALALAVPADAPGAAPAPPVCDALRASEWGAFERALLSESILGETPCALLERAATVARDLRARRAIAEALVPERYDNSAARRRAAYWLDRIDAQVAQSPTLTRIRELSATASAPASDGECDELHLPPLERLFQALAATNPPLDWSQPAQWRARGVPASFAALRTADALALVVERARCAARSGDVPACARETLLWLRAARAACSVEDPVARCVLRASVAQTLRELDVVLGMLGAADASTRAALRDALEALATMPPVDLAAWAGKQRTRLAVRLMLRPDADSTAQLGDWCRRIQAELDKLPEQRLLAITLVLDAADALPDDRSERHTRALGAMLWEDAPLDRMRGRIAQLKAFDTAPPVGASEASPALALLASEEWAPAIEPHAAETRIAEEAQRLRAAIPAAAPEDPRGDASQRPK